MTKFQRLLRKVTSALFIVFALLSAVAGYFRAEAAFREQASNRELAPESGRYVSAGDVDIFIQESGPEDGDTLLFIHGTGAWGEIWRETMIPLNAAGYRTIALDLPPFGFSDRPLDESYSRDDQGARILAVVNALELDRVTLVGHSFGGGPTVEAALMAPEKIERLILLDVGDVIGVLPFSDRPTELSGIAQIATVDPLRNTLLATFVTNPRMSRTLLEQLIHDPAAATDGRVEMLQRPMPITRSTQDFGTWLMTNFLLPQPEMLSNDPANYQSLNSPVLIIWGEEDTLTPLEQGVYMQTVFSQAHLQTMAGIGHVPQVESPEQVATIILDFLTE